MTTDNEQIVRVPLETWNRYADQVAALSRISTLFAGRRRMDVTAEAERIVGDVTDILMEVGLLV